MNQLMKAKWISHDSSYGDACPVFEKLFALTKPVKSAKLLISALGVYEANLNGKRVGEFILAPGWTTYNKRLQFQEYDVTALLAEDNALRVSVGNGWCLGRLGWEENREIWSKRKALIAHLEIEYTDGDTVSFDSDQDWMVAPGPVLFSEIYDGETYDARIAASDWKLSEVIAHDKDILIPQEGEIIKEFEVISAVKLIETPLGEKVIDFGQNLTGYLQFKIKGEAGAVVEISHAEILDKAGNFYTENLRSAKQKIKYICDGSAATYKPNFTFQGFRYIRLDQWPVEVNLNDFKAIVVHSNIARTGDFS